MFEKVLRYNDGTVFRQIELSNHFLDFCEGSKEILFITFENANPPTIRPDELRYPWAFSFLRRNGFSIVGVKPKVVDWYRKADLHEFFRSEHFAEFVGSFASVVLYGSSMGGYAALAFAEAFPGCLVIAHNPQSSLCLSLTPWDARFPGGAAQDWSGDFRDGAIGARAARRVYVSYDPFERADRRHVERLPTYNLIPIKVPFVGHAIPEWLNQMGVLKKIVLGVVNGTLNEMEGRVLSRKRRSIARYYLRLAQHTRDPRVAIHCLRQAEAMGSEQIFSDYLQVIHRHSLWELGETKLREKLALDPEDHVANWQVSEIMYRAGKPQLAVPYARVASNLQPSNAHYKAHLAGLLLTSDELDEATVLAKEITANEPQLAIGWRILSRALWARGSRGTGLLAAHKAVELDLNTVGLYTYATFLFELGSYSEAAEAFGKVTKAEPRNIRALAEYAVCLSLVGRDQEAKAAAESALCLDPNNRYVSKLLVEHGVLR